MIDGADILEVLHDFPELSSHVQSLYHCRYDEFFKSLCESLFLLFVCLFFSLGVYMCDVYVYVYVYVRKISFLLWSAILEKCTENGL